MAETSTFAKAKKHPKGEFLVSHMEQPQESVTMADTIEQVKDVAELIRQHADIQAQAIAGEATRQLDKAVKDGDELPAATITIKIVVGKSGDVMQGESEAKTERKQVAKSEKVLTEYDPNQPQLPGVEQP